VVNRDLWAVHHGEIHSAARDGVSHLGRPNVHALVYRGGGVWRARHLAVYEVVMGTPPPMDVRFSPCCKLPMMRLPKGQNSMEHWRCTECRAMWIWNGVCFVACQVPEKHYQLSQAAPFPVERFVEQVPSPRLKGHGGEKGR
jgi:hypothetical protein